MVRCAILLFDQVDLMDVAGPYEILLTASRLEQRQGHSPTFEVFTVAASDGPIRAYGGLRLTPDRRADEAGDVDVLIVPGAIAIDEVEADRAVMAAVEQLADAAAVTTSVCTGAFLLAGAGLLDGVAATTHWEDVSALGDRLGSDQVRDDVRWVDAGEVVTAGGISSGMAMALHLVERFASRDLAQATARQVDYVWTERRA